MIGKKDAVIHVKKDGWTYVRSGFVTIALMNPRTKIIVKNRKKGREIEIIRNISYGILKLDDPIKFSHLGFCYFKEVEI